MYVCAFVDERAGKHAYVQRSRAELACVFVLQPGCHGILLPVEGCSPVFLCRLKINFTDRYPLEPPEASDRGQLHAQICQSSLPNSQSASHPEAVSFCATRVPYAACLSVAPDWHVQQKPMEGMLTHVAVCAEAAMLLMLPNSYPLPALLVSNSLSTKLPLPVAIQSLPFCTCAGVVRPAIPHTPAHLQQWPHLPGHTIRQPQWRLVARPYSQQSLPLPALHVGLQY